MSTDGAAPAINIPGLAPIRFDPYIDGDAGAGGPPTAGARVVSGGTGPRIWRLDTHTGHRPAGQIPLQNGQGTMANVVGPDTLIVPPHTEGGVPAGFNPHDVADIRVMVDPHLGGGSFRVGELGNQAVQRARQVVNEQLPHSTDPSMNRLRTAAMYQAATMFAHETPPAAPLQPAAPPPIPGYQGQQAAPQSYPYAAPAPNGAGAGLRMMRPDPQVMAQAAAPAAPEKVVVFEIEGLGQFEAPFHDVVFAPGIVVLCYDVRYKGTRYRPQTPSKPDAPSIAIQLKGSSQVLLVNCLGLTFQFQHWEFDVLLVAQAFDSNPQATG